MHRRFLHRILSDNSEIIKALQYKSLGNIVIETFPVSFVSKHFTKHERKLKTKSVSLINLFKYLLSIYIYFTRNSIAMLRANKYNLKKEKYNILFFLPNYKYEDYLNAMISQLDSNYFIISRSKLVNHYHELFVLNDNFLNGQFLHLVKELLFFTMYPFYLFIRKDFKELSILFANYGLYHKLILDLYVFSNLFQYININKYFSLIPNNDDHRVIQLFFKQTFHSTLGIRPEQLALAEEEKFNISDTLFFKNDIEKSIYTHFKLQNKLKLARGGVLVNKHILNKPKVSKELKNILILDTCTNENPNSNILREKGLNSLYLSLDKFLKECNYYHKFHPGINKEIKKDTQLHLTYFNAYIVDKIEDFCKFDLVISYYSSLLQPFILSQVPVLLLTDEFDLYFGYQKIKYDLDISPIKKIKTSCELDKTINQISEADKADVICNTQNLFFWYKKYFNFPDGLNTIINIINNNN